MKRFFSLFLAIILICSMSVTAFADSVDSADSVSPAKLHVAREAGSDTVDMLAAEHLSTMKLQFAANPSALGFGADELSCALLGNAFTLYVFDTSGRIVSDDTLAYPVIYNDEIIAVLEVYYDNTTDAYYYTFGKAYAENLNELRYESDVNTNANLIIGRVADKLFITDGSNVDVIYEMPVDQIASVSSVDIESVCDVLAQNVRASFSAIVYQPKRAKKWKHSKWAMWGAFAACLCLVVGVFIMTHIQTGQEQPGVESPAGQGCFNATVIEITDDSILVECYDSIVGGISVGKKIQVSTNNISSERVPNLKLGDNIRILYIGNVSENEKELLILENTISIFLLDENGEVIIEDVN